MLELDKYGYTRDADTSVWVRPDYQGIAYSDGDSAENELARIVRDADDVSVLSNELPQYCTDWAKLYHLSSTRGNILRPFEHLLKGRSVLEIGAGCGAISRYLGEAGAQVLSLEGSPRRAAIAASRTRGLSNVVVLAERFDDFKVEQQFDVVTLIGVLEYASMFSADVDPAFGMLQRIRRLLKPNGHLFIAIENQLGLKYFAGAPEDHLGIPMYGIEGRYADRQPKTFGKIELEQLIARAGFAASGFLSPYPDYKLPNSIVTESGFKSKGFDAAALAWQNTRKDPQLPAHTTFNMEKAWPVVIDNRLGMDLANSFMVVASCEDEQVISDNILAYHYTTGRRPEYCKASVFVKTPSGIEVQYQRLGASKVSEPASEEFSFILPPSHGYAKGTLLSMRFLQAATTQDWTANTFCSFLTQYLDNLKLLLTTEGHPSLLDQISSPLPGHYVDAVPQNIIIDCEGKPHLIDVEWAKNDGVELGHLLTRGLLLLIAGSTPFSPTATMISKRDFILDLLGSVGLTADAADLDRYVAMELTLQEKVTGHGAARFLNWAPDATIPKLGVQSSALAKVATLYSSLADGSFSENSAQSQLVHDGKQTLSFTLPASLNPTQLRLDPVNTRQSFLLNTIKIIVSNDCVWAWKDKGDALLDSVGITAIPYVDDDTLFLSLNDDPYLLLPNDATEAARGAALTVEVYFTLLTEHQVGQKIQVKDLEISRLKADSLIEASRLEKAASTELAQAEAAARTELARVEEASRLVLVDRDTHIHNLNLHIIALHSSTSWRLTAPFRRAVKLMQRCRRAGRFLIAVVRAGGGFSSTAKKVYEVWKRQGIAGVISRAKWARSTRGYAFVGTETRPVPDRHDYDNWVRYYDTLNDANVNQMINEMKGWANNPVISVIMPVYNPPLSLLRKAIESVVAQLYKDWELCIADDASTDAEVIAYLESLSKQDQRIKVVFREQNGHISKASNSALELATGQYIALMDNDDLLPANALYWVARAIHDNPDVGVIYSDEDKIDTAGKRSAPYFKSDWNEFLFRSQNMVCHLGVYRHDLVKLVGGFREGFEGAQDYDLALRCIEKLSRNQIVHIPRVLYHWRIHSGSTAMAGQEKPYAALAGVKALDEHLQRVGEIGITELLPMGMYRVRYAQPSVAPLVSLIIPTRNAHVLVKQCIDSIESLTTYKNYEIILIDNGSDEPASLDYFAQLAQKANIRVMRDDGPFNYSALNNSAAKIANGDLIGLINNDIEVITPDWLGEMVSIALQPNVGAVGARLWYPDDRLQHGGVVVGVGGVAGHSHKYLPKGDYGYFCRAALIQEFSAVTAACLLIKKSIFEQVNGLDEKNLKIAFNDVDFCLRVQEAGYINVWTPFAELYHHESATRGLEDTPEKKERFSKEVLHIHARWPNILEDYTYNPNLTLDHEDFGLAWPPRIKI